MGMTLDEARELLASPVWPLVRDHFMAGNAFVVHAAGDLRRLDYLPQEKRALIAQWREAAARMGEWKKVIDGREVRKLKAEFGSVYPEIFKYEAYLSRCANDEERLRMILKLKFPDVLEFVEK